MRGNNERDPLDRWLDQQVRPLPPPAGTFELITRRARRRKLRKLAITVASVAAVAAGVAVAVPNLALLHLTPPQTSASAIANGQSTKPQTGTTKTTDGSATPVRSSSLSPSAGPTEPLGPVPKNFQPASVTFVDTQHGWAIGQAGTPGDCADKNPDFCTSVVRTDNAGQTWHGGPAPKTSGPDGPVGVSGIRFLDGVNGWAFGPELWVTHDDGDHWHQIPTGGERVTDLETVNGHAYALFASCPPTSSGPDFAGECTSYTLMTTTKDSDHWAQVGGATNDLNTAGLATSGVIALTGSTGYLLAPNGALYSGLIGGVWTLQGSVDCQPGPAQANGLPSRALLALQDSSDLAVACVGPSFGGVTVFTSGNRGATWTAQPASMWSGITSIGTPTSLTAAPNGTLVLATTNGLYVLPAGTSHWKPTTATGAGAPPGGFTYVGMTTNSQGVAVPADTGLSEIWMTFSGTAGHWAPVTPITPGGVTAAPADTPSPTS
jgi:hypothetical protein